MVLGSGSYFNIIRDRLTVAKGKYHWESPIPETLKQSQQQVGQRGTPVLFPSGTTCKEQLSLQLEIIWRGTLWERTNNWGSQLKTEPKYRENYSASLLHPFKNRNFLSNLKKAAIVIDKPKPHLNSWLNWPPSPLPHSWFSWVRHAYLHTMDLSHYCPKPV